MRLAPHGRISLLRSAVMEPVVKAAEATGVPLTKMARRVGFPLHMLESLDSWIPQVPCWRLADYVARTEGDLLFGLRAALPVPHQDVVTIHPFIRGSLSLYQLLERFCESIPFQTNTNTYFIQLQDHMVWFCRDGVQLGAGGRQAELFAVHGMLQLLQFVLGRDWRPDRIHLINGYCKQTADAPELNPSQIHFSRPFTALGFPLRALVAPVPAAPAMAGEELLAPGAIAAAPEGLTDRLALALNSFIGVRKIDKTLVSDITGMSLRSLQRQLADGGTSYREVLDRVRYEKACVLLTQTDERLQDISAKLGFENPPAFTRAFRRWAGVTPQDFRNLQARNS